MTTPTIGSLLFASWVRAIREGKLPSEAWEVVGEEVLELAEPGLLDLQRFAARARFDPGEYLTEAWRDCMDEGQPGIERTIGRVAAFRAAGLLSDQHAEDWLDRIKRCPGHTSPRSWCAYCGTVREQWTEEAPA